MIQRIQTVYLLLVTVSVALSAVLPIAYFFDAGGALQYQIDFRGLVEIGNDTQSGVLVAGSPLNILAGLILTFALVSIFKFKNRKFQLRLCTVNILLIIIYLVALGGFVYYAFRQIADVALQLRYPVFLGLMALIFNFLAMRGIAKDENLVRSMDRLR